MKKIIITALITVASLSLKAQTTWVEYNYLKRGVVDYLERGIDLKSGYKLIKAGNYSLNFPDGTRFVSVYDFIKTGNRTDSALLLIYSNNRSNKKTYIVVPTPNAPNEMWDDYNATLNTISHMSSALHTVSYALARYTSTKFQN